ncbi:MAG TPA: M20/M25/M40 family metallo-hydrolase [Humisphaera sp.]
MYRLFFAAFAATCAIGCAAWFLTKTDADVIPGGPPPPMPGTSFAGPLPPAGDAERGLADRLKGHVAALAGTIGERNVWKPEKLEAAAEYVERELRAMKYDVARQAYEAEGKPVRNLEAELPGADPKLAGEVVVVGAHYDSVRGSPGANDNASGCAAALELARVFKSADPKPARTVRFVFFVNEEPPFFHSPLMGSVVYAKRCKERNEKVVAMLSLETVGFYSDAKGSQKYPPPFSRFFPDTGNFVAFVGDTSAKDLVTRCVGTFRASARFPCEGTAIPDQVQGIGWSDHWSFTRQGYPALMVTDTAPFRYKPYHTADDTPDKVDHDRVARVVGGLEKVVAELVK